MPQSLYIHWPFCLHKCPYCDFNVHLARTVDEDAFTQAFITELTHYAGIAEQTPLCSIFFGGGTPSLMRPQTVETIINTAQNLFGFDNSIEISLEANPTSTESLKLAAFRQAGINRLSLGIQALNDADLKKLGRTHDAQQAMQAIEITAKQFDNFSFDLIYARPDQTIEAWEQELSQALAFAPKHLSLYQLTIEPNTQFHTLLHTGRLRVPNDDLATDFYLHTQTIMTQASMPAYEVSNHALAGFACTHNLNYWQGGQYIGIGPGAHGRLNSNGQRLATTGHRAPEPWLAQVTQTGCGAHPPVALNEQQVLEETLMFGLRLKSGIPLPVNPHLSQQALFELVQLGFLTIHDNWLAATDTGRLVVHSLVTKLVP